MQKDISGAERGGARKKWRQSSILGGFCALIITATMVLQKRRESILPLAGGPEDLFESQADPGDYDSENVKTEGNPAIIREVEHFLGQNGSDHQGSAFELRSLRERLVRTRKAEVIDALTSFLSSGRDWTLSGRFELGPGGWLAAAPTARCWAIDALTEMSVEDAMVISKRIFDGRRSADEWVLGMRILGLAGGERLKPELEGRFLEMLADESWRRSPSGGYLEGFDTLVYLGSQDASEPVAKIMLDSNEHPVVRNAAGIALDRTIGTRPELIGKLYDELIVSPKTLAYMLAAIDVTDPVAARITTKYVMHSDGSEEGFQLFGRLFPYHVGSVGYRLLSPVTAGSQTPARAAEIDFAAAEMVDQWIALSDPGSSRSKVLMSVRHRLNRRLQSIARGRAQGPIFEKK